MKSIAGDPLAQCVLAAWVVSSAIPAGAAPSCVPAERSSSLGEVAARIEAERVEYVFIGERHGIGPVKRFAVDLANALIEDGLDVGLYVEGFRTDCPSPGDGRCWSLARAFNQAAFDTLLSESRAPVHAIDPPVPRGRAGRMAETIAAGREAVRVILVGRSHVVYAGDPKAELWVYGGRVRFADPGDLVEAFPRHSVLTVALETSQAVDGPYSLRESGCEVDYVLTTQQTGLYWGARGNARGAQQSSD